MTYTAANPVDSFGDWPYRDGWIDFVERLKR